MPTKFKIAEHVTAWRENEEKTVFIPGPMRVDPKTGKKRAGMRITLVRRYLFLEFTTPTGNKQLRKIKYHLHMKEWKWALEDTNKTGDWVTKSQNEFDIRALLTGITKSVDHAKVLMDILVRDKTRPGKALKVIKVPVTKFAPPRTKKKEFIVHA